LIGFIGADSSQMVLGLYTSEIWPSKVRGVGSGLCFAASGVGKITGPLGLGLIAGSANIILPQATRNAAIPAFAYLAFWFAIVSAAFFFLGIETRGRTLEQIEAQLDGAAPATRIAAAK
jgi:putative MFS transporter